MDCDFFLIEMIVVYVIESEKDDFLKMIENFEGFEEVLFYIKILKDESNLLFKKGDVQVVRVINEYAGKLFFYVLLTGAGNKNEFRFLDFFFNFNITVCVLKLNNFYQVLVLCLFVLKFDSDNVKVFFRRVLAVKV